MKKHEAILARVRAICLSFPETKETLTWGEPHFRVRDRIFAGCGLEKGRQTLGFKLERPHAEAILDDPRFRRAPYVGHAGWVSMDTSGIKDWDEVRELLTESYRLIAPKSCWKAMSLDTGPSAPPRTARSKESAPSKATKRTTKKATKPAKKRPG